MDVGGTFTDRAALTDDGHVVAHKVLSTPGDQGEGVVHSLAGLDARAAAIVHGTTVVTNLLLERRGARVVLCTTEGAEDVLLLRRQDRASLYDLSRAHPAPLVAREDVIGVRERIVMRDAVAAAQPRSGGPQAAPTLAPIPLVPLDGSEIARVVAAVLAREPEIVLIALLHSYADASHERMLAEALRAARPALEVVTSSEVLPEIREYERFATASAEAYARPAVMRYLRGLGARLDAAGQPAPSVMTSGGGMQPADAAARHAAALALSGPAGGIVGAAAVLRALREMPNVPAAPPVAAAPGAGMQPLHHFADALTMDIGGTSADAGLILAGEPLVESGGDVAGVPIALPRVLVETVSAGGGSIAWVDDGGALRVGPRSAGARPGPVAFGRGGTEPTVTDAQLVLGRIAARSMSGGVSLDVLAANAAIARLAQRLGSGVLETARAIIAIADAEMARALRRVSVERGVDPRECTLVAFGGGGPLHACALADALSMPRVLVPPFAGVLSAVGLALAPERYDAAVSVIERASRLTRDALRRVDRELSAALSHAQQAAADHESATSAAAASPRTRRTFARVRYVGQGHELEVPVQPDDDGAAIAARFAELHASRVGFTLPADAEIVAMRLELSEPARAVRFVRSAGAGEGQRSGAPAPTSDAPARGPATVALSDATMFVAEGWTATPLAIGGWLLERHAPVAAAQAGAHA